MADVIQAWYEGYLDYLKDNPPHREPEEYPQALGEQVVVLLTARY